MREKPIVPNVTQTFYDRLAPQYDQFYTDWDAASREEAVFLSGVLTEFGFDRAARILDCACGIGTQAIGLAALGYAVTGSDLSAGALAEAGRRAAARGVSLPLHQADFCRLSDVFSAPFDVILAMDNALPHLLSAEALAAAAQSITGQLRPGGIFIASIRDYDALLRDKPRFSAPYIHKTERGQRVLFQTWDWTDDCYHFIQYIIEDEGEAQVRKLECDYRATCRAELTALLQARCCRVIWRMPEETGFYQPIVIAVKPVKL